MAYLFKTNLLSDVYGTPLPQVLTKALYPSTQTEHEKITSNRTFMDSRILMTLLAQHMLEDTKIKMKFFRTPIARSQITEMQQQLLNTDALFDTANTFTGIKELALYPPQPNEHNLYVLHPPSNLRSLINIFKKMQDVVPITSLTKEILTAETSIFKCTSNNHYFILMSEWDAEHTTFFIRLISLLPRLFESVFKDTLAQDEDLQNLFIKLTEYTYPVSEDIADKLYTLIQDYITSHFDLRKRMITLATEKLNEEIRELKITQLNQTIRSLKEHIKSTENMLKENYETLQQQEIMHTGYAYTTFTYLPPEDIDLVMRLKNILTIQRDRTTLDITWESPLNSVDLDLLEKYKTSPRTTIWTEKNTPWEHLIYLIFEKRSYELLTRTQTKLNLSNNTVTLEPILGAHYISEITWIPHPHLSRYTCLGTNKLLIEKELKENNLLNALYLINAATQQYNITDGTVTTTFVSTVDSFQNKLKLRCKADQKFYTIAQAMNREEQKL